MTLKDVSNGPDFVIWMVSIVCFVLSIVLLSGKGSWLIAGYNTASKEEKNKYDEKKLCRIIGAGMAVITVMLVIMGLGEDVLPEAFAYIFAAVTVVDCAAMIILANTICKNE